ncbi:MAG: ATP-binding protein [Novosphingobium sp.]|nr:MAG: ATP-binding protein [Novosphingobium sp.]
MSDAGKSWTGVPVPFTGRAAPETSEEAIARATFSTEAFRRIYVDNDVQDAIVASILILMRSCRGLRGVPLPGRRLSQISQAGKSKIVQALRTRLAALAREHGLEPNPHQVLYLELKGSMTLRMIWTRLLRQLGDPHFNDGNTEDLLQRLAEFVQLRGVEVLVIDEVQVLKGKTVNKVEITDELRGLLNDGIVPVVFIGDERSKQFFEDNEKLAGRLGRPLELLPLDLTTQAKVAKDFCASLDDAMVAAGCTRKSSNLATNAVLNPLLRSSGQHLGRICRIVEAALEHAVQRDADFVEPFDLWHAVETFAIRADYTKKNHFVRKPRVGS